MEVDSGGINLTFLSCSQLSIPTFSYIIAFPECLFFLGMKNGSQKSGEVVLLLVFPAPWEKSFLYFPNKFSLAIIWFSPILGPIFSLFSQQNVCHSLKRSPQCSWPEKVQLQSWFYLNVRQVKHFFVPLSQLHIKKSLRPLGLFHTLGNIGKEILAPWKLMGVLSLTPGGTGVHLLSI